MTAKEMASYAKRNVLLSGVDMDETYTYSFMPEEFKNFVNQLCKEQREICLNELHKKVLMDRDETKQLAKIVVLNAPQPQIFKEGNA